MVISEQEPENQSPGMKQNLGREGELGVCAEKQSWVFVQSNRSRVDSRTCHQDLPRLPRAVVRPAFNDLPALCRDSCPWGSQRHLAGSDKQ